MGGQNEFGVNKGVDNDNYQKADEEEEERGNDGEEEKADQKVSL